MGLVMAAVIPGGNPSAVATAAESGGDWSRLAGPDRFGTAAATAAAAFPNGAEVVYLARADLPVDAVAAGSLDDGPVLLVPTDGPVPPATERAIVDLAPSTVIALGGSAAVSDAVLRAAANAGDQERPTDRIAGADRYGTATAISRRAFPDGSHAAFVAAGIPDALAAGVLTDGPVLLVPPGADELPPVVRRELDRLDLTVVHILTGPAKLDQAILRPLDDPDDPGGRVDFFASYGPDRIATATRIAEFQFGTVEVPTVYVAAADSQVDALSAGSLRDGPILLAPTCGPLPEVLTERLEILDPAEVVGLGGPAAVCDDVLDRIASYARAPFPELATTGTLHNATPAPRDHVEPFLGSRVTPLAWSRDGDRLLVFGTPPGRPFGVGDPPPGASGIDLYVHDIATDALLPVQVPDGWWVYDPELAALTADGSEVFVAASKSAGREIETWLLALPVGEGPARKVRRGSAEAASGSTVVLGSDGAPSTNVFTVVDTTDESTWDPGLDRSDVSEIIPTPDADALLYHTYPRQSVMLVRRDGTRRTLAEPESPTRCRVHGVFAHDVSDDASHALVRFTASTPPDAPTDCPRAFASEVRVLEVATGRSAPLATADGDPIGELIHDATLSPDGSVIAFGVTPAARDGGPFDGAPGPVDGERAVLYRVGTADLLAGDPDYRAVSSGADWEHAHAPVAAVAGSRIAWTAVADGRVHGLPSEVVLYRVPG